MVQPLSKVCELEDFACPGIRDTIREVFGVDPIDREYRKHWEVAMALLALQGLSSHHEVLGVGAGNEPTLYHLTNRVRRVFATDLYAGDGWEESASPAMLTDPGRYWQRPWNPRRLVVQHMDARDLRYEDGSFDGIFSSSSLEHFGDESDATRALAEMHRVLRPGGILSLSTEFRLAGPPPGLPGVLMFDQPQLEHMLFDDGLSWKPADGSFHTEVTPVSPVEFADATADVRAHVAERGALYFADLVWTHYPQIVLRQGDLLWTSVHVALRKPRKYAVGIKHLRRSIAGAGAAIARRNQSGAAVE